MGGLAIVVGIEGAVSSVQAYRHYHQDLRAAAEGRPIGRSFERSEVVLGAEVGIFLIWMLSTNLLPVGLVLGIVYVAQRFRSWLRAIALAVATIAAAVGAFAVERLPLGDGPPSLDETWRQVAQCLGIAAFGFALLVAAVSLMGLWSRQGRASS